MLGATSSLSTGVGGLGAEAGTDIRHTCSCLFSLLHVAITALLCRAYNGSGHGYMRKIYWEQPDTEQEPFQVPRLQRHKVHHKPAPPCQARGKPLHTRSAYFYPWFGSCLNSRIQLRIQWRDVQPSRGEHAATAHCCVGVDALHEVCCGNVWERGEKTECPRMRSNGNSHILYSITL